jgi:hypothetical protein
MQQLKWNEDLTGATLITQNEDGSITCEPLTIEEAAQWTAKNKY